MGGRGEPPPERRAPRQHGRAAEGDVGAQGALLAAVAELRARSRPEVRLIRERESAVDGAHDERRGARAGEAPEDEPVARRPAGREARDQDEVAILGDADVAGERQVARRGRLDAVGAGADYVLLDNMNLDQLRAAVALVGGRCQTEASGGISLANVRAVAETGVDFISVGALTHSARAVDIGLDIEN